MKKIAFIGGDKRMNNACEFLKHKGIESYCYNSYTGYKLSKYIDAIKESDVVLPAPLTTDGIHIRNTFSESGDLTLLDVCKNLSGDAVLFSGKLDLCEYEVRNVNYMNNEEYLCDMAYLTAEGALGHVLFNSKRSLATSKVMILGWGRIAKCLYKHIAPICENIIVILRNERIKKELNETGVKAYSIDLLADMISDADIILNTIPERIIFEKDLRAMKKNAYIAELASAPYGYDGDIAEKLGLNSYKLGALPGKCAPETAGEMLGKCIYTYLKENGEKS